MQDLNITLVQANLKWQDHKGNLAHLTALIENSKGDVYADLIILPETFTTGFSTDISQAENMDSPAMLWMNEIAGKTGAVVTGSLMMEDGDKFYNRLIWMRPDGSFEQYDKRHLFGLGNEGQQFTKGSERLIVELKGWKVCPLICYDLRFPVWSRNNGGYDLLLYVANWPDKRSYAWKQLLVARAIENQSYVVGVNRVGDDGNGFHYAGDSRVVDPMGEVIFSEDEKEVVKTVTLSYNKVVETREKLPFLNDRDTFEIK